LPNLVRRLMFYQRMKMSKLHKRIYIHGIADQPIEDGAYVLDNLGECRTWGGTAIWFNGQWRTTAKPGTRWMKKRDAILSIIEKWKKLSSGVVCNDCLYCSPLTNDGGLTWLI